MSANDALSKNKERKEIKMSKENIEQQENNASKFIEDLTLNETETENVKGGVLIGLLLPAVQKVR